jgi:hypothetical protein
VDRLGPDALSRADYEEFRRVGHIVRHVPEILSLVQDTLRPRSFAQLLQVALDDGPARRS